jgi:hypothetical protein
MSSILCHETRDGRRVEYRRVAHPTVLVLEHRCLRPDGLPHDDRWYPVSDSHLLALEESGSDIVSLPAEGEARS